MAAQAINPEEAVRFFKLSGQIFWVIAEDGRLEAVNPAAVSILGYSLADYRGASVFELVHPDDAATLREILLIVQTSGTCPPFICRFRAADGSFRHLLWNAVKGGARIYATIADVTDFKRRAKASCR